MYKEDGKPTLSIDIVNLNSTWSFNRSVENRIHPLTLSNLNWNNLKIS